MQRRNAKLFAKRNGLPGIGGPPVIRESDVPAITGEEGVKLLRETLAEYDLRIEFSTALSIRGAHPCATFYTKDFAGTNRWKKVGLPLMLPTDLENGTRADLLRQFADLLDGVLDEKVTA